MAGWRVGVIVGKKEWVDSILTFKSNMDTGMFYPIQAAAETALALGEEWFRELNAIYYEREKQGYAILDALGCTYRPHQAGLFIWAEIPGGDGGHGRLPHAGRHVRHRGRALRAHHLVLPRRAAGACGPADSRTLEPIIYIKRRNR